MEWQPIETAPRVGDIDEIIVLINSATVPIIRSAWWNDGSDCVDDLGWWSYRHSVTQEMLVGYNQPIAWMPLPDDTDKWMDVFPNL